MDVGGPFSESLTLFCQDLFSESLSLFTPCPNKISTLGFNQDKWIPTTADDSESLMQFEFVGMCLILTVL